MVPVVYDGEDMKGGNAFYATLIRGCAIAPTDFRKMVQYATCAGGAVCGAALFLIFVSAWMDGSSTVAT